MSTESGGWGGFDDKHWTSAFEPVNAPAPASPPLAPATKPKSSRRLTVLRPRRIVPLIVFSIALATSVLHALGSPDHSTPASAPVPIPAVPSAPSPTPTGPAAVYGDPSPAALKPAVQAEGRPRTVCVDETRPLPARGAWTCHSTVALDGGEIGRRPTDPGGPCTHRAVSEAGGSWNCWTRIAIPKLALGMPYAVPLMFGHIQAADAGSAGPDMSPRVCREQSRTSETQGPWRCVSWQDAPDGWRIAEPLDPGGPCSYRIADEETGVWSCQSATAQDTQAP